MSAPVEDGGPAFPVADTIYPNGEIQCGVYGMTLRDWFAGQALAGLMANHASVASLNAVGRDKGVDGVAATGRICYDFADAMLAARKEGKS